MWGIHKWGAKELGIEYRTMKAMGCSCSLSKRVTISGLPIFSLNVQARCSAVDRGSRNGIIVLGKGNSESDYSNTNVLPRRSERGCQNESSLEDTRVSAPWSGGRFR